MAHSEFRIHGPTSGVIRDQDDFSLAIGGPLYQLYLRTRLARPPLELVQRRIVAFILICWFPPLVFSLLEGRFSGGVSIPFVADAEVHTRFLGALPLLIAAELMVHKRMRAIVQQFLDRNMIAPEDRSWFEDGLKAAMRLRNSVAAEVVILIFVFTAGHWLWSRYIALGLSSWCMLRVDGVRHFTGAGYWYAFISMPILRFVSYRWLFRLFIWYRFLWRVRSRPLRLNYFHPDRAGGLGFLAGSVLAFSPILVAQSIAVAGAIGNRIWHMGARLVGFELEIVGSTLVLALLVLAPLCFFVPQLALGRLTAQREFGILSSRYVNEFRSKWIKGGNHKGEALLGTSDIQSLADLANSFAVVNEMRLLPFNRIMVMRLLALILAPMTPLILTMFPIRELVDRLVKLAV